ncbi:winged helix-turn-helix transcriptional regulator [Methanorbis furvi]|uniref:winged helix-turn-helix transcriptional regulator n=1 Tax=Methanorbis furvi TaxID=3028299 RepID=UPI0030B86E56
MLFVCISVSSVTAAQEGVVYFPLSGITVSPGDPDLISDGMDDENPIIEVTGFDFSKPAFVALFLDLFNIHDIPVWAAEGIALALAVFTGGFAAFLFTRRKLSEDPASRPMQILAFITEHHGCRQSDIITGTGFSRGSVSYNLIRLIRKKKIRKIDGEEAVTYVPAGTKYDEKDLGLVLLTHEKPLKIFTVIAKNPGISQKQIGERTGLPTSTLRWHLSRLEKYQVICMEKDRNLTQYTASQKYADQYGFSGEHEKSDSAKTQSS